MSVNPKRALGNGQERSVTCPETFVKYILQRRAITLPPIPRTCIITHSRGVLEQACRTTPHQVIDFGARRPVELFLFGPADQPDFAMVASPLGAPMVAVLVEELIALGFAAFISVGSAGHPAGPAGPRLAPGDLVLVDNALVYEGTSGHYTAGQDMSSPDPGLLARLRCALQSRDIDFHVGAVATTDALYRESPAFLEEILVRHAIAIDMELSALFTVAAYHGRKAAGLLYISDIVQDGAAGWQVAFNEEQVDTTEDRLLDVMLEAMRES